MEQTIMCSIVGLTEPTAERQLINKLSAMPGVTQVTASGTEGRVVITGKDLNQKVFIQAIEQTGIDVVDVH